MAGFTENALIRKLQELNSSQQSIQTLSLWLIHHRKHHAAVVKTWYKELLKVKDSKQLTFMYLANDVIQNSKKKGPEYGQEFGEVLEGALKHMAKTGINAKTKHSLHRILNIWQERGVYDAQKIQELKVAVDPNDAEPKKPNKRKSTDTEPKDPEKKPRTDSKREEKRERNEKREKEDKRERRRSETKVEVDGQIETHTTLSPKTPPGDPPEPDELIRALLELESSASSDEAVRERIASLPPEVSEVQLLSKLEDKESAVSLSAIVNSAVDLLAEYNLRLTEELEKRRKVAAMLRDFAQAQRDLAKQAEARLEEYNVKLQKIYAVKTEVKSHIENLPDVSQLPDVTGGLAPLPSAGDLFSI
ncbi:regulation of nuclear pre-mRNA domain-containing protein 1B [Choristoneura fumiferana]|uniref:regulation of nuclear pre-mRNA domain-containing protein 1B n=1 Tax=Choristoneura fumiferana TaxID=7141 RepID=UPI003D15D0C0